MNLPCLGIDFRRACFGTTIFRALDLEAFVDIELFEAVQYRVKTLTFLTLN